MGRNEELDQVFDERVVSNRQEIEYIEKAARGDHEAFHQLVLAYEASMLTYLHALVGDWESARDLAQETFIAAFYALPRWQHPALLDRRQSLAQKDGQPVRSTEDHPLAPWLYRIAANRALTFLRQQNRHRSTEAPALVYHEDEPASMPQALSEGWEDHYAVRELLHEALSQLASDDAICIILRFVAGERYAEIAESVGITTEAARKRVARGLVALRAIYQALDREKS